MLLLGTTQRDGQKQGSSLISHQIDDLLLPMQCAATYTGRTFWHTVPLAVG